MTKVLIAGSPGRPRPSIRRFDSFVTSAYEEGAGHFIDALERGGHQVVFQPNHVAAIDSP